MKIFRHSLLSMMLLFSSWGHAETAFLHYPGVTDIAPGQIRLVQIDPNVWVHISSWRFENGKAYPSNGLIVRQDKQLFLVDPAWGEAASSALLKAIDEQIGLPVRLAVSTHFHDDRVAGDTVFKAHGIDVYATPLTRQLAADVGNVVPAMRLDGLQKAGDSLRIGPLDVFYPGAGHTIDNLVVYLPESHILFGGCAVHEQARDNAGNTADADLAAWPASLKRIQARYPEAKIVVPGHGVPGGQALLSHSIRLVENAGE